MSAAALQHRWEHQVQSAPAPTCSNDKDSPTSTSARDSWLLSGLIDRTTSHWAPSLPLHGGADNDEEGTEATAPDDDDTITDNKNTTTDLDDIQGTRIPSPWWCHRQSGGEGTRPRRLIREERQVGWINVIGLLKLENMTYSQRVMTGGTSFRSTSSAGTASCTPSERSLRRIIRSTLGPRKKTLLMSTRACTLT